MITLSLLWKQPWFKILVAAAALLALLITVYFYGKSRGKDIAAEKFDKRQESLLKQSQEMTVLADQSAARALAAESYANQLKYQIALDTDKARENEKRITQLYAKEMEDINKEYEDDKNFIASNIDNCKRCLDLCERTNKLSGYGPEFANYKCDPGDGCTAACNTGDSK